MERLCRQCKAPFDAGRGNAAYCSEPCRRVKVLEGRRKYNKKVRGEPIIHAKRCAMCNEGFTTRHPNAKFCGVTCREKYGREYALLHKPNRVPIPPRTSQPPLSVTRRYRLKGKYGITEVIYDQLMELQDDCCAICGALPDQEQHRRLPIDHCHTTKKVRGLLCTNCNTGIGSFKDDPALLAAAINYLRYPPMAALRGVDGSVLAMA